MLKAKIQNAEKQTRSRGNKATNPQKTMARNKEKLECLMGPKTNWRRVSEKQTLNIDRDNGERKLLREK